MSIKLFLLYNINEIYIYIYIFIYIYILYIYIYIYIYIYMSFVCFVYCNIVGTRTRDGHTGFTLK